MTRTSIVQKRVQYERELEQYETRTILVLNELYCTLRLFARVRRRRRHLNSFTVLE